MPKPWEKYAAEAPVGGPWGEYGEQPPAPARQPQPRPIYGQPMAIPAPSADVAAYGEAVEIGRVPTTRETPPTLQPTTAANIRGEGAGEEAVEGRLEAYRKIRPFLEPVAEGVPLAIGATAGIPGGPATMAAGGGLGYAIGKQGLKLLDEYMGYSEPEPLKESLIEAGKDVMTGVAYEAGGQVISKAVPVVAAPIGRGLKKAGERVYKSAAKIPTTISQAERSAIARTGLREKIMPTEKGLGRLAEKERALFKDINDAVEKVSPRFGKVSVERILKGLNRVKDRLGGADPVGNRKIIDRVADKFRGYGEELSVKELHQIKKEIYQDLPSKAFQVGKMPREKALIAAQKGLARGAKEVVEEAVPGIKELNRRAGELIELSKVLNRTVSRVENNNLISLNTELAAIVGAEVKGAGGAAVLGATRHVFGLPRIKARIAMALYGSGKQFSKIAEVFKDYPTGQQFMREYKNPKVQSALRNAKTDATKEKWLTNFFKKNISRTKRR